jgi:DNA-binding transcriptional LysR family regulator
VTAIDRARPRRTSIMTALEATRLGLGAGDLPCFIGDAAPELERVFPRERPESVGVWLVVHTDVQRSARVRVLVDELARVFRKHAARLASG